jgi:xanthine dehydrogenase small subunit
MFDLPGAHIDRAAVTAALTTLAQDDALHYAAPALGKPADAAPDHFHAPRSAAELAQLRTDLPGARLLGGATDVGLWVTKGLKSLGDIVYIGAAADLGHIEVVEQGGAPATLPTTLRIGAAVSLEDGWRALAGHWPELTEVWRRFASPPVRHAGTLVGNLANGSPIGDSPPVAIALGASLVLRRGEAERRMLLEDFYVDYMKNQLQPGEFVSHVELPLPTQAAAGTRQILRAWKISKRYDSDISALCAGLALTVAADGTVADARLAFGGMAATVRRAKGAEAALRGQPWSEAVVRAAMAALAGDYAPLTDLRATSSYRVKVAANLLWRLWLEAGTPAMPASSTQVWVAGGLLAATSA